MLWDIIRDWFVQYVFGGLATNGETYSGLIGYTPVYYKDGTMYDFERNTGYWGVLIPNSGGVDENLGEVVGTAVSMGDWLSTTATIITLIALCLFLFLAVKWVFNVFRNTLERVGK